jgi:hypothetical protein
MLQPSTVPSRVGAAGLMHLGRKAHHPGLRRRSTERGTAGAQTSSLNETNGPEQAGGQRREMLHVLRYEANSIAQIQQIVVGQRASGNRIDRRIPNNDPQLVSPWLKVPRHVEFEWGMPDRPGLLSIDVDYGRFTNWTVEPCTHSGAGRDCIDQRLPRAEIEDHSAC